MIRRSNTLALLDSEHRLQILQQLRSTLRRLLLVALQVTRWRRQHWPYRVIANDVIVTLCVEVKPKAENRKDAECPRLT